jgi:hypothetical protein
MIEIVHSGVCPNCHRLTTRLSWQGNDPHEIPEFAKFAVPVLYCCGLPFKATQVRMISNGRIISERLLEAA